MAAALEFKEVSTKCLQTEVEIGEQTKQIVQTLDQTKSKRVHSLMRTHADLLQELRLLVPAQDDDASREAAKKKTQTHEQQHQDMAVALRAALLQVKKAEEQQHRKDREELLAGGEELVEKRKSQDKANALRASNEVSAALRRLRSKMNDELERTSLTVQTLDLSSQTLDKADSELTGIGSRLRQSGRILSQMSRRHCTDVAMLVFGIVIFLCVVLYVLKRRLLD